MACNFTKKNFFQYFILLKLEINTLKLFNLTPTIKVVFGYFFEQSKYSFKNVHVHLKIIYF